MSATLQRRGAQRRRADLGASAAETSTPTATLFERHVDAARRLARQLVRRRRRRRPGLRGVRQGARRAPARRRPGRRVPRLPADRRTPAARRPDPGRRRGCTTTDDMTPFDPGVPFRDTAVEGFENAAAAKAFASPARALAAGAVAHRGRGPEAGRHRAAARHERQLRLRARLPRPRGPAPGVPDHARRRPRRATTAAWTHDHLGAYVRDGVCPAATPPRSRSTSTTAARAWRSTSSSTEVNSNLAGLLGPMLLGRRRRRLPRRRRRGRRRAGRRRRRCSAGSATS